jgi:hypothetical protein
MGDFQDTNKKPLFSLSFSSYYFLKVHRHNFFLSHKEVTKHYFCLGEAPLINELEPRKLLSFPLQNKKIKKDEEPL